MENNFERVAQVLTLTPGGGGSDKNSDVVKTGYLTKLKGRKKWFVVRKESDAGPARLEYYAKERNFTLGKPPKKSIVLRACFNINRTATDSKVKWAIALHTHNDCLRIAMSSEEELKEWLRVLNSHSGSVEEASDDVPYKPHFEHIWMVQALNKGLGAKENILGPYRLGLTARELTLLKIGDSDSKNSQLKFPLNVIRAVSHDASFGCFFHIEFGRFAVTGPGLLSLKTEDNTISKNMHLLILTAMQSCPKESSSGGGSESSSGRERCSTWTHSSSSSLIPTPPPPLLLSSSSRLHSLDLSAPPPHHNHRSRTDSLPSHSSSSSSPAPSLPLSIIGGGGGPIGGLGSLGGGVSSGGGPMGGLGSLGGGGSGPMGGGGFLGSSSSASSSYSTDYENNNNGGVGGESLDYVAYEPSSSGGGGVEGRSSVSPINSPLSPERGVLEERREKSSVSVSHSRDSSLLDEIDGYVEMRGSGGPTTILPHRGGGCGSVMDDDEYFEMESGSSSRNCISSVESLHGGTGSSRTPSSEFPLEKVSSYFTSGADEEFGLRPLRAYSVGSRSDTNSTKSRFSKNRLEAVQETRNRAQSVGSSNKNPRLHSVLNPKQLILRGGGGTPSSNNNNNNNGGGNNGGVNNDTPTSSVSSLLLQPSLSSSWSGSTGRWPLKTQISPASSSHHSHQNSENDSDLMELDFTQSSKSGSDKRGRKKSVPTPPLPKLPLTSPPPPSPLNEETPSGDYMPMSPPPPKYPSSSPIAIERGGDKRNSAQFTPPLPLFEPRNSTQFTPPMPAYDSRNSTQFTPPMPPFDNFSTGPSLLTRMTGLDLNTLKKQDEAGAYMPMNFEKSPNSSLGKESKIGSYGRDKANFFKDERKMSSSFSIDEKLSGVSREEKRRSISVDEKVNLSSNIPLNMNIQDSKKIFIVGERSSEKVNASPSSNSTNIYGQDSRKNSIEESRRMSSSEGGILPNYSNCSKEVRVLSNGLENNVSERLVLLDRIEEGNEKRGSVTYAEIERNIGERGEICSSTPSSSSSHPPPLVTYTQLSFKK